MRRLLAFFLTLVLLLSGCGLDPVVPMSPPGTAFTQTEAAQIAESSAGELQVHFIDVGQADCVLLCTGGHAMLIDGGNVDDSSLVASYLLGLGIEELSCVVATHPHEDHAGGLGGVMAVFPVETVYVTTTTYASKCYDDFIGYTDQQGLTPVIPQPGDVYHLGECDITFLGPVQSYADTNNTSLVCRADFRDCSFLFTGDMETDAEGDLLDSGADVSCDVLKVGHHGSSTSTGYRFLYAADPDWAVISCGQGNSYGHPHDEVISRLEDADVSCYRTDLTGTVVAVTDGNAITFTAGSPAVSPSASQTAQAVYIGNKNSHKFHLPTCANLPKEENRVEFSDYADAISSGYQPCGGCLK